MRESPRSLEAYRLYESLGPARSLDRVAQQLSKSRPLIARWSKEHAWVERAAAYERKLAEQAAAEEAEERKRARKQRLQVARGARSKGVEALTTLTPADLARLPSALVRLLEYADSTERKDLGEPDQRLEVSGAGGGAVQIEHSYDAEGAADVFAVLASAGVLAFPARAAVGGGAASGDDDPPAAGLHSASADS